MLESFLSLDFTYYKLQFNRRYLVIWDIMDLFICSLQLTDSIVVQILPVSFEVKVNH